MSALPPIELWLTLTPEENVAGGEYPIKTRRNGVALTLKVQVPPGLPDDEVLRLRGVDFNGERYDLHVRRVVRAKLPGWPATLIGAALFTGSWLWGQWLWGLFGGLFLIGFGLYGRITGWVPLAGGPARRVWDLAYLAWLTGVVAALSGWLSRVS
jgi:hypothetical protein